MPRNVCDPPSFGHIALASHRKCSKVSQRNRPQFVNQNKNPSTIFDNEFLQQVDRITLCVDNEPTFADQLQLVVELVSEFVYYHLRMLFDGAFVIVLFVEYMWKAHPV